MGYCRMSLTASALVEKPAVSEIIRTSAPLINVNMPSEFHWLALTVWSTPTVASNVVPS